MKLTDINQVMNLNESSLSENYDRDFWLEMFGLGKTHSFVAIYQTQIIGYIFCDNQYIISFAINEKYRGLGIGKNLLSNCLNTFNIPIRLHVRISNNIAIKLYNSYDFKIEDTMENYYTNPDENAYSMIWSPNKKYEYKRKLDVQ